jgi:hypothetical protein
LRKVGSYLFAPGEAEYRHQGCVSWVFRAHIRALECHDGLRGSARHTPNAGKNGFRIAIESAEFARVSTLAIAKGVDHSHPENQRTQLIASWQRDKD